MTIKVAINGYGRIGRNILRAHYEGRVNGIVLGRIVRVGKAVRQHAAINVPREL